MLSLIHICVLSLEDGTVFVTSDFADIADTSTIRQSLSRLVQSGTLRRILKGVYEKPKYSKLLDEYVAAEDVYKRQATTATGYIPSAGKSTITPVWTSGCRRAQRSLPGMTERSPLREMPAVMACVSLLKARHTKDIP